VQIAILGFGLIGGSLARALRRPSALATLGQRPVIVAWSPTGDGPRRAAEDGSIDRAAATVRDAVVGTDLIVLAAPPLACLGLIDELAELIRRGSADRRETSTGAGDAGDTAPVVTDVASTKAQIVSAADARGLRFVGGHPLAGRETTGYAAATADLFDGRPWVIVPGRHAEPRDAALVERVAVAAGARPVRLGAVAHDDAVAAISHLPLVLSAALAEAMIVDEAGHVRGDWPTAAALAATGWQSMTRLARGDIEMGAGIAAMNAAAIALRLRDLRRVLDSWLAELENAAAAAAGGRTGIASSSDSVADPFREHLGRARDRLTDES
jgi:prephenate dehydrogenase